MASNSLCSLLVQRPDQVAVGAGQQAVGHFDHRDLAAQGGIDGAHFQPDVAAADDQQRLGHVGQFQRAGGIHHAMRGQIEGRNPRRARAGGHDAMLEARPGRRPAACRRPASSLSVCESSNAARARITFTFRLAAELLQAAGERGDDLFLAGPHGGQVDRRLREGDAPIGQMLGLGHGLGHVQQGLRGDAAAQQADAAQPRFEIDQRDLHAQVGGQKRGRVSARSAAEDAKLSVHGRKGLGIRGQGLGTRSRGHALGSVSDP